VDNQRKKKVHPSNPNQPQKGKILVNGGKKRASLQGIIRAGRRCANLEAGRAVNLLSHAVTYPSGQVKGEGETVNEGAGKKLT